MLSFRSHGEDGPSVVVLHGGPGAPGSAWGLAHGLSGHFRVLEPMQRRADVRPLSVARHLDDLRILLEAELPERRPAIVGSSWGAMLALAFAAAHPHRPSAIVLVGCGTFDLDARAELTHRIEARMTPVIRAGLDALASASADPDRALADMGALIEPLYTWDPLPPDPSEPPIQGDARGHREAWDDMIELQTAGVYPASFAAYRGPVLMLHGEHDPHPGPMIRDSLRPWMPQLEYRELPHCGHHPWRERGAREEFFQQLTGWLNQQR